MPDTDEQELFREDQPLHQNMIARVVMLLESIVMAAVFIPLAVGPSRQNMVELLLAFLALGVVLPWWVLTLKLVTIVTDRRLVIRYRPMPGRDITLSSITGAESIKYRPIADCGGWGWRMSPKYHRVFNVSGNRGVHIRFGGGRRDQFLVGSRRPDELADAIGLARFEAADSNSTTHG